jgi:antitoxin component of MazEF toxin-antitoxin module
MKTHLVSHGHSKAVVIPSGVRKLLGITDSTPLEVTTDGKSLVLTPTPSSKRAATFEKARKAFFEDPQHRRVLMVLADR